MFLFVTYQLLVYLLLNKKKLTIHSVSVIIPKFSSGAIKPCVVWQKYYHQDQAWCLWEVRFVCTFIIFESLITYHRHMKTLERVYQACLRRILSSRLQFLTADTIFVQCADTSDIKTLLIRMYWVGHLNRMEQVRLRRQRVYREMQHGRHPRNPKKSLKDVV